MLNFDQDLLAGLKMSRRAFLIAKYENSAKFRRTILGPYWAILAVAFGSFGIAVLWSALFKMPWQTAIPTITTGFLVWFYVSNQIVDGVNSFTSQSHTILSINLPFSFYPLFKSMFHGIGFAQSLIIVILINLVFPPESLIPFLFFPLLFILTFANLYFLIFLVAFLNTRFRDIGIMIQSLMPLLFFLSPVVFRLDQLAPQYAWVLSLNPMTHMIICLRDPLIGSMPDPTHIIFQCANIVFSFASLRFLYRAKRRSFCYWL